MAGSGTHFPLRSRLLRRVRVDENTGCWLWLGYVNPKGYGKCAAPQIGEQMAHRVSYRMFVGPIPDGLTIDHTCRVRNCVNPQHLEPVTQRENSMRGDTIPARHAAKTHCDKGHPLAGDNLYIIPSTGQRQCKTCVRAAGARYRARKRQQADTMRKVLA